MEIGTKVKLFGLKSRPDLNGRIAKVSADWDGQRYGVNIGENTAIRVVPSNLSPVDVWGFARLQQRLSHELFIFANCYTNAPTILHGKDFSTVTFGLAVRKSGSTWMEVEQSKFLLKLFVSSDAEIPYAQILPHSTTDQGVAIAVLPSFGSRVEVVAESIGSVIRVVCDGHMYSYANRQPLWHMSIPHMTLLISDAYVPHVISNTFDLVLFFLEQESVSDVIYSADDTFAIFTRGPHTTTKLISFASKPLAFKVARNSPSTQHKLKLLPLVEGNTRKEKLDPARIFPTGISVMHNGVQRHVIRCYERGGFLDLDVVGRVHASEVSYDYLGFLFTQIVLASHFLDFCEQRSKVEKTQPSFLKTQRDLIMAIYGIFAAVNVSNATPSELAWRERGMKVLAAHVPIDCMYLLSFPLMTLVYDNDDQMCAWLANLEALACALTMLSENGLFVFDDDGHVVIGEVNSNHIRVANFASEPIAMAKRNFAVESRRTTDLNRAKDMMRGLETILLSDVITKQEKKRSGAVKIMFGGSNRHAVERTADGKSSDESAAAQDIPASSSPVATAVDDTADVTAVIDARTAAEEQEAVRRAEKLQLQLIKEEEAEMKRNNRRKAKNKRRKSKAARANGELSESQSSGVVDLVAVQQSLDSGSDDETLSRCMSEGNEDESAFSLSTVHLEDIDGVVDASSAITLSSERLSDASCNTPRTLFSPDHCSNAFTIVSKSARKMELLRKKLEASQLEVADLQKSMRCHLEKTAADMANAQRELQRQLQRYENLEIQMGKERDAHLKQSKRADLATKRAKAESQRADAAAKHADRKSKDAEAAAKHADKISKDATAAAMRADVESRRAHDESRRAEAAARHVEDLECKFERLKTRMDHAKKSILDMLLKQLLFYLQNAPHMCIDANTINIEFVKTNAPAAMNLLHSYTLLEEGATDATAFQRLTETFGNVQLSANNPHHLHIVQAFPATTMACKK